MASLVGQQLKDTYDSLLKTSDNDALGGTYKEITDGAGNGSNLYLGTGGNVGIGTDNPSGVLEVKTGSGVAYFTRTAGDNGTTSPAFGILTSSGDVRVCSSGDMQFKVGAVGTSAASQSEVARFTSDGLTFNGDTASTNALDDYEEGTWTPVFAPETGSFTTMTMDVSSATYTKIGRQVTVRAFFETNNVDATGASGQLRVSGLPFASAGSDGGWSAVSVGYVLNWGTAPDSGIIQAGQSIIRLRKTNATVYSDVTDLTTGATNDRNQIILTATYFV